MIDIIQKPTKEQWDNFWIGVDLEYTYIHIVLNQTTMKIMRFDTYDDTYIWYINNTNKGIDGVHLDMFAVGDNSINCLINMGFNVLYV